MKERKSTAIRLMVMVLILSMITVGCSQPVKENTAEKSEVENKPQEIIHISIGTASVGGAFYPIGISLAQIWNDAGINVKAVAQATAGSPQNIELLRTKDIQVATIRDQECYKAIEGLEKYEGNAAPWLRTLFPLPTPGTEIFALIDSGIETIADFKGKKVAVGPIGSGGEADARELLALYGLTFDDIKPEYVEASQAVEMMKDGHIQAAFLGLTGGSAIANELMSTKKAKLVPIEDEKLDEYIAKNPSYNKFVIEANFYPNQDYEVLTRGGVPDLLAVREDMSDELAYELTKAVVEKMEEFQQTHSMVANWSPEVVSKVKTYTQMHPGAEKYWKEIGVK